eukprot:TRINITY_DN37462_c0_g1_i1.p1 TRINITY_DN37462_c0_g1~~TRINITY_DN37462_c0_g1_i1.p1  ORF type:complete len:193 (-),score=3.80 TRINITY_DN37462_c0_g1_i1:14-592(-)
MLCQTLSKKKYACYYFFHEQYNLQNALSNAKSANDIANAYAFASVQRLEPNLDYLVKIYENSTKSRILDFLLLREINKIEDWIYTPYYTNYLPSLEFSDYWWSEKKDEIQSTETLRARSEKDRLYACLLYTSDAADDMQCVDLGGRRIIKKKKEPQPVCSYWINRAPHGAPRHKQRLTSSSMAHRHPPPILC